MNKKLIEGVADALGFVLGSLLGMWVGRVWGFDVFQAGYGSTSVVGILLCGLGGGLGLQAARAVFRHFNPH